MTSAPPPMSADEAAQLARRLGRLFPPGRVLPVGVPAALSAALRRSGWELAPGALQHGGDHAWVLAWSGWSPGELGQLLSAAPAGGLFRTECPEHEWSAAVRSARGRCHPLQFDLSPPGAPPRPDGTRLFAVEHQPAGEPSHPADFLMRSGEEAGRGHLAYHLAHAWARPRDVVLDLFGGAGAGARLLRLASPVQSVLSVLEDEAALRYAARHHAAPGTTFVAADPAAQLARTPDASVDLLLLLGQALAGASLRAWLDEAARVLTPGGRLVTRLAGGALEQGYPRGFGREQALVLVPGGPPVGAPEELPEGSDCVVLSMKPPSTGARVPYRERHFTPSEQARAGHALAFGRDYDNPWLVRALVAPGLRTAQDKLQVDWAEQAVQQSAEGSADLGAALCVLSYRALDRAAGVEGMTLRARVDAYLAAPASSPNAFRWKVSLAYVSALLALEAGKRDRARALLGRVVEDAERTESYSPTLLTKTAEAAWLLGLLSVRDGHPGAAVALWRKVAGVLGVALRRYWSNRAGAPSAPGFELREISMVTSLLGRLEAAATALEEAPGSGALLDDAGHADLVAQVRDADQVWRTKLWLEHQLAQVSAAREWLEENRLATQRYVAELLEGKAWLEGQLEAARGGPGPG